MITTSNAPLIDTEKAPREPNAYCLGCGRNGEGGARMGLACTTYTNTVRAHTPPATMKLELVQVDTAPVNVSKYGGGEPAFWQVICSSKCSPGCAATFLLPAVPRAAAPGHRLLVLIGLDVSTQSSACAKRFRQMASRQ